MTEDELKAKYGTIRTVVTAAGTLSFRKPTRPEWKKYKVQLSGDAMALACATENLMLDTIVSHTREELLQLLDGAPGVDNDPNVATALRELCGVVVSVEGKT